MGSYQKRGLFRKRHLALISISLIFLYGPLHLLQRNSSWETRLTSCLSLTRLGQSSAIRWISLKICLFSNKVLIICMKRLFASYEHMGQYYSPGSWILFVESKMKRLCLIMSSIPKYRRSSNNGILIYNQKLASRKVPKSLICKLLGLFRKINSANCEVFNE